MFCTPHLSAEFTIKSVGRNRAEPLNFPTNLKHGKVFDHAKKGIKFSVYDIFRVFSTPLFSLKNKNICFLPIIRVKSAKFKYLWSYI